MNRKMSKHKHQWIKVGGDFGVNLSSIVTIKKCSICGKKKRVIEK